MRTRVNKTTGKGETFDLALQWFNNGEAVDLTGYEATFYFVEKNSGDEIATAAGAVDDEGHIAFHIADEVTATWPTGTNKYRVEVETPSGDIKWLLKGDLSVMSGAN